MPATNEIQEHLEIVQKFNRTIAKDYEVFNTFDPREPFDTFDQEAAALIEEAEAMTGAHITAEGIKNKIREDLEALEIRKVQEAAATTAAYRQKKAEILEKVEKAIHSRSDMAGQNPAEITLRNSELEGEVRGNLYSLNTPHSVVLEFDRLAAQSVYDKSISRFLSKNSYLFLDHIKSMDISENEKGRAFHSIMTASENVKHAGYSDKEIALFAVRDSLKFKEFSTTGARINIQQKARVLINKYQ